VFGCTLVCAAAQVTSGWLLCVAQATSSWQLYGHRQVDNNKPVVVLYWLYFGVCCCTGDQQLAAVCCCPGATLSAISSWQL
jgi:hypothetical protein